MRGETVTEEQTEAAGRHARQIALGGWGEDAQRRLVEAYVVIVGVGALGGTLATLLAAAGVGHLGVVDGGTVDDEALGGQTVHFTPDRGAGKADSVVHKVGLLDPAVHCDAFPAFVDHENAAGITADAALVADCCRDGAITLRLAAVCAEAEVPLLVGTAAGWRGATFALEPGADIPPGRLPQAADDPALAGPVAAAVAADLAQRALALLGGVGDSGLGTLRELDGQTGAWSEPPADTQDE